jgi:hypothetical protein
MGIGLRLSEPRSVNRGGHAFSVFPGGPLSVGASYFGEL